MQAEIKLTIKGIPSSHTKLKGGERPKLLSSLKIVLWLINSHSMGI